MFDTMRHIRPDVSTVCVGLAASMGAFLLASGHKARLLTCYCGWEYCGMWAWRWPVRSPARVRAPEKFCSAGKAGMR